MVELEASGHMPAVKDSGHMPAVKDSGTCKG